MMDEIEELTDEDNEDTIELKSFPLDMKTEIEELLVKIVESGDYATLEDILYGHIYYININSRNDKYETLLMISCKKGHEECFKLILKDKNTIVNDNDCNGDTVLHHCIKNRNKELVCLLLEDWRIDINKANQLYETPLHLLAQWGEPSLIQLIVKNTKLDINKRDFRAKTALQMLMTLYGNTKEFRYLSCIQILLSQNDIMIQIDSSMLSYLDILMPLIINHPNLDVNNFINNDETLLSYSIKMKNITLFNNLINRKNIDVNKGSPIIIALEQYKFDLFNRLIEHPRIDVDENLIRCIFLNCFNNETIIHYIQYLLTLGRVSIETVIKQSVLHQNIDVLKIFLEGGKNYIIDDIPLLFLALMNSPKVFYYLIMSYKYDLNILLNKNGNSLLHEAIYLNDLNLIRLLIDKDINCNIVNNYNQTALERAVDTLNLEDNKQLINVLLEKTPITLPLQLKLLNWNTIDLIKIRFTEHYGQYLENMPDYVFERLIRIAKENKYSLNSHNLIRSLVDDLNIDSYGLKIKTIDYDECHNVTDPGTLEDFKDCDKSNIIQYGNSIQAKYRSIQLETLIRHTQSTGYGYLRDITDPIDRSYMYTSVVKNTQLPIYIDCIIRSLFV